MRTSLELTRDTVLSYRRRVSSLDGRLPDGPGSRRRVAKAGLTDSMPRAALLSLHARVEGTTPDALEDPALAQVWGPRFSAYVVAADDAATFTLGRLAAGGSRRARALETADRLAAVLAEGERVPYGEVGRALGTDPNMLRYAAPTGTIRIGWDGARQPLIWRVPPPAVDEEEARLELARRYLHVLGPSTPESFARWAGVTDRHAHAVIAGLARETVPVRTPVGEARILAADEASFRQDDAGGPPTRLLPSGDTYYLYWGAERHLLVPDAAHRDALWTSRVWPGAVLVAGEIVGTWRRTQHRVTVAPWRRLAPGERGEVEEEAASLPLPGIDRAVEVGWEG